MMIRAFTMEDEDALVTLWNRCLPADPIDHRNLRQRILYDSNFDPKRLLLAVAEDNTPTGFLYSVRRIVPDEVAGLQEGEAWHVAGGVDPAWRRRGIGTALLAQSERELKATGTRHISVGPYATNYIVPGVDLAAYPSAGPFLSHHGYEAKTEAHAMHIHLRGYQTPARYRERRTAHEAEGYRFRSYQPSDWTRLLAFMRAEFPHWLPEVRRAVLSGHAPETLILAFAPYGAVIGFVLRAMDGTSERFGPFGTAAAWQGRGIGAILFHAMLENLVAARVYYTYFLWTSGRNLEIYGSWGMEICRSFTIYAKSLT
ncbi:MAG: GNAT family N-acetyltransferase [Bacillota bacterium]|nr:GNAT family N-acetyltransferase [Bacillota bacterium]